MCQGSEVLTRQQRAEPRRHAENLTPLIHTAMADAGWRISDLDAIAVGTGPAPFTGLRTGLITARALARGSGANLYGTSSLDVLARQVLDAAPQATVLIATDARRREVYAAHYSGRGDDDVELLWGPEVGSAAHLATDQLGAEATKQPHGMRVAGAGALLYPEALAPSPDVPHNLDAAVLARIVAARLARQRAGDEVDLTTEPRYLRRPDVTLSGGPKRVT